MGRQRRELLPVFIRIATSFTLFCCPTLLQPVFSSDSLHLCRSSFPMRYGLSPPPRSLVLFISGLRLRSLLYLIPSFSGDDVFRRDLGSALTGFISLFRVFYFSGTLVVVRSLLRRNFHIWVVFWVSDSVLAACIVWLCYIFCVSGVDAPPFLRRRLNCCFFGSLIGFIRWHQTFVPGHSSPHRRQRRRLLWICHLCRQLLLPRNLI